MVVRVDASALVAAVVVVVVVKVWVFVARQVARYRHL